MSNDLFALSRNDLMKLVSDLRKERQAPAFVVPPAFLPRLERVAVEMGTTTDEAVMGLLISLLADLRASDLDLVVRAKSTLNDHGLGSRWHEI